MNAYVTFLATENFLPGVLVLHKSLRIDNHNHDFLVMITESISFETQKLLTSLGCKVRLVPEIKNPVKLETDPRGFGCMYTKLRMFGLTGYEKIIYMDSDLVVCGNIESLFQMPHMSAVMAGGLIEENRSWRDLNAGLLVIEPSLRLFDQLYQLIGTTVSKDGSDQGFLQTIYSNWRDEPSLHLPHTFNIPFVYIDAYCDHFNYSFSYLKKKLDTDMSIIHYWGPIKPWHLNITGFSRRDKTKQIQSLILWWDIFNSAIKEIENETE